MGCDSSLAGQLPTPTTVRPRPEKGKSVSTGSVPYSILDSAVSGWSIYLCVGRGGGGSMVWFPNYHDNNSDSIDVMMPVEGVVCMGGFGTSVLCLYGTI